MRLKHHILLRRIAKHFAIFWALVAVVFGLYWQTRLNPFIFDDSRALGEFFEYAKHFAMGRYISSAIFHVSQATSYMTFAWLDAWSHTIQIQRLFNISLHAFNSYLLYIFIYQLFKERRTAAFMALFFAINPAAMYAVAYLVQRNILLVVFFGLIQCILFYACLNSKSKAKMWTLLLASVMAFLLAKSCKDQAVPLLAAYPLLLVAHGRARLFLQKYFTFILMVFLYFVAFKWNLFSQDLYGDLDTLKPANSIRQTCDISNVGLFEKSVITQLGLYFRYFATWLLPLSTTIDMRFPLQQGAVWPFLMIVYLLTSCGLFFKKSTRLLGFGMLLTFCLFSPELSRVRLGDIFVVYRSYLFAIGYMIVIAFFIQKLPQRLKTMSFFLLIPLAFITYHRLDMFGVPATAWKKASEKLTPKTMCQGARIYNNIGGTLLEEAKYIEAIPYLEKALTIQSDRLSTLSNLGFAYIYAGKYAEAEKQFQTLMDKKPNEDFMISAYLGLGTIEKKKENYIKAMEYFTKVTTLNPLFVPGQVEFYNVKRILGQ